MGVESWTGDELEGTRSKLADTAGRVDRDELLGHAGTSASFNGGRGKHSVWPWPAHKSTIVTLEQYGDIVRDGAE